MPIRHTKRGWFWGSSGPHKTRKKAVEISQAAHAQGFQEKSLEKQQPPRPGLVPKSGDPKHPYRWVRPEEEKLIEDEKLEREGSRYYLTDASDNMLGYATLLDTAKPTRKVLRFISVKPQYRGKGYASKILRRVLADADRMGTTLELETIPYGDVGLSVDELAAWYSRYGFHKTRGGIWVYHPKGVIEKTALFGLEKQQPPRLGLVPKSGDPQHPERWIRPQQESLKQKRQEDARRVVGNALEELSRKLGIPLEKPWEKKPQFPYFSPEEQNNLADMSAKAREMEGKKHTNMRPTKRNKMEKQAENYTLDDLLELLAGHKDEQENTDERLRTQLVTMGVNLEQVDTRPAVDIFAEHLQKEYGVEMEKQDIQKLRFTTKRGKVESSSVPQHRLLHGRKLPHTHIEGDGYKRETFGKEEIEKQVKDPWAVATWAARRMGYEDFSQGSEGQQKRDEIAESLKRTQKMEKQQPPRPGLVPESGDPQHPYRWVRPKDTRGGKTNHETQTDIKLANTFADHVAEEVNRGVQNAGEIVDSWLTGVSPIIRDDITQHVKEYLKTKDISALKEGVIKTVTDARAKLGIMEKHDAPIMHDHSPKTMRGWFSPSHLPLSSPTAGMKKGGPGSGRKPKYGIPSAIGRAIGTYRSERTPTAHQGVVEAFQEKEGKHDPLAGLEHPWDKPMRKAKGIYRLKRKQKALEGRM